MKSTRHHRPPLHSQSELAAELLHIYTVAAVVCGKIYIKISNETICTIVLEQFSITLLFFPVVYVWSGGWAAGARVRCCSGFSSHCLFVFFSEIYFRHFIYSGLLHAHPAFPLRHSIQMLLLMVLLSGMFVLCKCLFNSTSKKQ